MSEPSWMITLLAAAVCVVSVARVVRLHAARLTAPAPAGFLAFLEMAGWLVLALASGAAALRMGSAILWVSTGAAGALLVVAGLLRKGSKRG